MRPSRSRSHWRSVLLLVALLGLAIGCGPADPPKPTVKPKTFVNDLGITFVRVPDGTFRMGNDEDEGSSPAHQVTLSPFWIMREEVTNRQYERFRKHRRGEHTPGPDHPVAELTRKEVLAFAAWLSKRDGRRYGLPSEAQWEYAARAGRMGTDFPWGTRTDPSKALSGGLMARPVGSYPPNAFGLHDMIGNVGEMVHESWYRYDGRPKKDPRGSDKDEFSIARGLGVGLDMPWVWFRSISAHDIAFPNVGFRLVVLPAKNGGR